MYNKYIIHAAEIIERVCPSGCVRVCPRDDLWPI